jgi:membrane associated rhomboid family serine protease
VCDLTIFKPMEITLIICLVTALVSLAAFNNQGLMSAWMLDPYLVHHRNQWWRMLSSGFIHADFMHLFFNMFSFYFFGRAVETYFNFIFEEKGFYYYLLLYLGAIIIGIAHLEQAAQLLPSFSQPSFLTPGIRFTFSESSEYPAFCLGHSTSTQNTG